MSLPPLIWDEFHAEQVPPEGMDELWKTIASKARAAERSRKAADE